MKFEVPIIKKEPTEKYNTTFRTIESGKNEADNQRIEKFNDFSSEMKEALCVTGKIFQNITYPWAIQGSLALVLEGETAKKPDDIDLAFGIPDYENVLDKFKELEKNGIIKDLKIENMLNFNREKNGCIKIVAKIKTSNGKYVDIEAFSQNVDPGKQRNGISNPGLDKTGVNVYKENDIEINFADREEIYKYYLQVAYIELQKYQMDERCLNVKNKFPQRLQNLISIILGEKFENQLKNGEATKEQKPDFENITDEDINKLIEEFLEHNSRNESLKLNDFAHSKIDPAKVIKNIFNEFRTERLSKDSHPKGFVQSKIENPPPNNREEAVDELTKKQLADMENITSIHNKLTKLNDACEQTKVCDENEILKTSKEILETLSKKKIEYEEYLNSINYEDNKDFIPFISMKAMLEGFIMDPLRLAILSQSKFEKVLEHA